MGNEDDRYAEEEARQEEVGAEFQVLHPKDPVVELPGASPHHDIAGSNHQLDQQEVQEQTHLWGFFSSSDKYIFKKRCTHP